MILENEQAKNNSFVKGYAMYGLPDFLFIAGINVYNNYNENNTYTMCI